VTAIAFPEVRLFFAVEPSVEALGAVLGAATRLREGPLREVPLRWSNPEGWHVTAAFLGNVDVGLVPSLRDLLPKLSPRPRAPALTFEGLVGFPSESDLRVLVRGVGGAGLEALAALEAELRTALEALGLAVETPRPYTPHLTLARARGAVDLGAYGASVERVRWEPVAVTLYESRPEAGRRRYVPLGSVPW
jgi:2'-5' RNA ligase